MNILKKIIDEKKKDVFLLKIKYKKIKKIKIKSNFIKNISENNKKNKNSVIAEFKRYSPSVKKFKNTYEIEKIIKVYEDSKATCISVLTDKNFGGTNQDILKAKKYTKKPIIRKDFIIDKIQIYESALIGAEAILLIARILSEQQLLNLEKYAHEIGLDVLIEIESQEDLNKIKKIKSKIIGINNRNLAKQTININKTIELSAKLKNKIIVSESGITRENIEIIKSHDISVFLIGGSILNSNNVKQYINDFCEK